MPPVSAAKMAACQWGVLFAATAVVAGARVVGTAVVVWGSAVVVDREEVATWTVVEVVAGFARDDVTVLAVVGWLLDS